MEDFFWTLERERIASEKNQPADSVKTEKRVEEKDGSSGNEPTNPSTPPSG